MPMLFSREESQDGIRRFSRFLIVNQVANLLDNRERMWLDSFDKSFDLLYRCDGVIGTCEKKYAFLAQRFCVVDSSMAVDIAIQLAIEFDARDVVEVLEMMSVNLFAQLFVSRVEQGPGETTRNSAAFDEATP